MLRALVVVSILGRCMMRSTNLVRTLLLLLAAAFVLLSHPPLSERGEVSTHNALAAMIEPGTFTQISLGSYDTACGIRTDTHPCLLGVEYLWAGCAARGHVYAGQRRGASCMRDKNRRHGSLLGVITRMANSALTPSGTFTQISSGNYFACGLKTDGSLACWGQNYWGQANPPLWHIRSGELRWLACLCSNALRHPHLLGRLSGRPDNAACRYLHPGKRRSSKQLRAENERHHHLLGCCLLWPA